MPVASTCVCGVSTTLPCDRRVHVRVSLHPLLLHLLTSAIDIEFKLNGDNTVLRSCNFKDPRVQESGDLTANMSFFLARPRGGLADKGGGSLICQWSTN